MKIYDISMNINPDMTVYKNKAEKKPKIEVMANHENSNAYESRMTIDLHTGTHIDAPLHMIKDSDTIENYNLESFIRKCKVFDLTHLEDKISAEDLKEYNIQKGDFILFKTKNSFSNNFDFDFIYVDKSAALLLKNKGVIGVGIDALGIERNQPNHETHITLLEHGVIILEGLRLKDINEGQYTLHALPLKIDNVEAAPTRAVLIKDE